MKRICPFLYPVLSLSLGLLIANWPGAPLMADSGGAFRWQEFDPPPLSPEHSFTGTDGREFLMAGGIGPEGLPTSGVYRLNRANGAWEPVGHLSQARAKGVAVSHPSGVVLLGGITPAGATRKVTLLQFRRGGLEETALPELPNAGVLAGAATLGRILHILTTDEVQATGDGGLRLWTLNPAGRTVSWQEIAVPPSVRLAHLQVSGLQDVLFVFGIREDGEREGFSYSRIDGWKRLPAPPQILHGRSGAVFGHAHIFYLTASLEGPGSFNTIKAYHTVTGSWIEYGRLQASLAGTASVLSRGEEILMVDEDRTLLLEILPQTARFPFPDQAAVLLYLAGMILIGFYFAKRERSTKDFFRAGNRIPWWAAGMSLFATGASAISLMSMPGKSYFSDWTYFGISLYAVISLPIALFLLAPLIRRLAITTPGDYLERRFGLGARMLAASIYAFTQVGARMGSVMLLPSIAMSAITGIPIVTCILVMGLVTTIYTFLGGLEAVIWTDTIQGFVMIFSVVGCLVLILLRLEGGFAGSLADLREADKLRLFDLRWDLTYPTAYLLFITTVLGTMGGIGDQNFVQRVQCTPSLKQTKMAVATQLGVAVPINVLLFTLGTALYLFYRQHPEQLNPAMKTDSIFPFFVAQQLPVGVSGLVVAALLAATMSTISSSICGVANIGVEDFARRFIRRMTDHTALILGRILTALIGLTGMGTALYLSQASLPSVWDLAQMITNLISNGVVGLFGLGLLTKRAHQLGAMLGVACGMAAVFYFQNYTDISFWAFSFIGSVVTFTSGYLLSLLLPGKPKEWQGLTIYSLPQEEIGAMPQEHTS